MFIMIDNIIYNMDNVASLEIKGDKLFFRFTSGKGICIKCEEEKYAKSLMDFVSSKIVLPGNDFNQLSFGNKNVGRIKMSKYNIGDKLKFRGNLWTVTKTKPGKVLLKGYGYRKWFDIEEIEREKQHENETL